MYLLACPCGSIIKGHLRLFSIMIPFSIEFSSFGNPTIVHCWMETGLPKNWTKLVDLSISIPLLWISDNHCFDNLCLKSEVKTPLYEIIAAEIIEFPGRYFVNEQSLSTSRVHLIFSSESPDVSFLALSSLISHYLISAVSFSLLLTHSSHCF